MWLLGWVYRWACELYSACSRALVSYSALYVGNVREASGQAVFCVWKGPEDYILGVVGYVFLSSQGEGHGVAL